jgi:2-polyprenyl-3-methyl-5-hydroxy-6-metoxy-1,4-benzoquinol methylase
MNSNYWNDKVEWLKAVRTGWFNEDYIQFLVEKVWNINKPVSIIDFGCGFGFVGLILLPILPKGSTYTGIDISENLINEAQSIFKDSGFETSFIQQDLHNYKPVCKYDIAISQAVLRHIPNAKSILSKMIESVLLGGLVICMETDLELEKAGLYFKELNYSELGLTSLMRKLWEIEIANGGRDYRFAIKIPFIMQELNLKNIGVRMSDNVYFINPSSSDYKK